MKILMTIRRPEVIVRSALARAGRIIWGVGPAFLLPAATNRALGSEKFSGRGDVAAARPSSAEFR